MAPKRKAGVETEASDAPSKKAKTQASPAPEVSALQTRLLSHNTDTGEEATHNLVTVNPVAVSESTKRIDAAEALLSLSRWSTPTSTQEARGAPAPGIESPTVGILETELSTTTVSATAVTGTATTELLTNTTPDAAINILPPTSIDVPQRNDPQRDDPQHQVDVLISHSQREALIKLVQEATRCLTELQAKRKADQSQAATGSEANIGLESSMQNVSLNPKPFPKRFTLKQSGVHILKGAKNRLAEEVQKLKQALEALPISPKQLTDEVQQLLLGLCLDDQGRISVDILQETLGDRLARLMRSMNLSSNQAMPDIMPGIILGSDYNTSTVNPQDNVSLPQGAADNASAGHRHQIGNPPAPLLPKVAPPGTSRTTRASTRTRKPKTKALEVQKRAPKPPQKVVVTGPDQTSTNWATATNTKKRKADKNQDEAVAEKRPSRGTRAKTQPPLTRAGSKAPVDPKPAPPKRGARARSVAPNFPTAETDLQVPEKPKPAPRKRLTKEDIPTAETAPGKLTAPTQKPDGPATKAKGRGKEKEATAPPQEPQPTRDDVASSNPQITSGTSGKQVTASAITAPTDKEQAVTDQGGEGSKQTAEPETAKRPGIRTHHAGYFAKYAPENCPPPPKGRTIRVWPIAGDVIRPGDRDISYMPWKMRIAYLAEVRRTEEDQEVEQRGEPLEEPQAPEFDPYLDVPDDDL
ncbi:hypothetical protein M011DRAFT_460691 [Sporormia fimetaria CBS 119925]|uniref:Uncharacterized protein n=1 Tax=Sporormia fimetaria CBS 119925 TaxID=1340428 RepID=A0A6A6V553_9PLEO|nr:hypothetical protein M011DRAFT_460691 [Sporormia fimetaria CBS 119925]